MNTFQDRALYAAGAAGAHAHQPLTARFGLFRDTRRFGLVAGFATVAVLALVGYASLHRRNLAQIDGMPPAPQALAFAEKALGTQRDSSALARQDSNRDQASEAGAVSSPSGSALAQPQMLAHDLSFTLTVKDLAATRRSLEALLIRNGGYAAQMTSATPESGIANLQATLRVPMEHLAAATAALRALGRVSDESDTSEDVTPQHADLGQRLATARETEDRLRAILQQRTGSLSDVLQVEEEMARVRGEIESMQADQANLEHRVDYATIELNITQTAALASNSVSLFARMHDALTAGYRHAAAALLTLLLFALEYGLVILFWSAILAIPIALVVWHWLRRHGRLAAGKERSAPAAR